MPDPPDPLDTRGWQAVYRNVRTRLHALLGLMDPSPYPKNRRLSDDRFVALTEDRRTQRTDAEWAEREARLEWFQNALLEMSVNGH